VIVKTLPANLSVNLNSGSVEVTLAADKSSLKAITSSVIPLGYTPLAPSAGTHAAPSNAGGVVSGVVAVKLIVACVSLPAASLADITRVTAPAGKAGEGVNVTTVPAGVAVPVPPLTTAADAIFSSKVKVTAALPAWVPPAAGVEDNNAGGVVSAASSSSSSSPPQPAIQSNIEAATNKAKILKNLFITTSPLF
jgi:hypothetical protein